MRPQVVLQWSLQQGLVINPRSRNPAHMQENLALFDPATAFTLSADQMALISSVTVPTPSPNNKVMPTCVWGCEPVLMLIAPCRCARTPMPSRNPLPHTHTHSPCVHTNVYSCLTLRGGGFGHVCPV